MKILLNMRGIRARAEKFLLPEPINLTLTVAFGFNSIGFMTIKQF